jgi:uncharacterized protein (TIGR00661 family)
MNILLGVQTTGNGHIVRSSALLKALRERGHAVRCLLSGPSTEGRWNVEQFQPFQVCSGLTFTSRAGKIDYVRTALDNKPVSFLRDVSALAWRDLDLVISDYEPVTAWMARRRGLPSIGIGHLYAFVHDVPKAGAGIWHQLTNGFAPVQYPMGSHWHHFDQTILPPTVADDVHDLPITEAEHVLVYLPFEDQAAVIALLQQFPDQRFRVYSGTETAGEQGNVTLCRIGRKTFIEDLASSRGVICNAGFSLVSEALHLGKKVLVKPLTGQVEQESNALALEQLRLGRWMQKLCADSVRDFLAMAAINPCHWPQIMGPLADWIDAGHWDQPQSLMQQLWPTRKPAPDA